MWQSPAGKNPTRRTFLSRHAVAQFLYRISYSNIVANEMTDIKQKIKWKFLSSKVVISHKIINIYITSL